MKDIGDKILKGDQLLGLVQEENFVGWIYTIDYDTAQVMTSDLWKTQALGVPHNCFLVAASFNPNEFSNVDPKEREIILLRVVSSAKLPQDDDLVRAKIDRFQIQKQKYGSTSSPDYDNITLNQMQFHGLKCRVLGTFYTKNDQLWLGSDLESFVSAASFNVYRPRQDALKMIANYVDPMRLNKAAEEMQQFGIRNTVSPFPIGTVRYTSTDRLHRSQDAEKVPVSIQPTDFLARRTAVLGMTRTGKSNMVKQMVSVVKRVANEGGIKIGQIIYDINGEYANANQQDKGAIAEVYPGETVRYRMLQTDNFEELQNNFYIQINEGFSIIRRTIIENQKPSGDVEVFLNTSFDEPDFQDKSSYKRWQVRVAAYKALLRRAEFPAPSDQKISFEANENIRKAVSTSAGKTLKDPKIGLTLDEAVEWFLEARTANQGSKNLLISSSGKPWFDNDTRSIINMIARANDNGTFIKGHGVLADSKKYHSPRRNQEVGDEIYKHLIDGKIIILDLSVGDPALREKISQQIAADIFNKSMNSFLKGNVPPNIVVYIEEAHNLIGKGMDLTDTWPRLAKEGAKYRIALVYATQEVSSVHSNILANTENWFVTHLNNDREIKELARFYDFEDFSRSLLRAQDVGFARVKTLSSPFVIPVQIDLFDPKNK
jgi:hypothetical protein